MGEITVSEKTQELDEALSDGLQLKPSSVRNYYIDNVVKRVISYLMGWDTVADRPVKLSATSGGLLKVSAVPILAEYNDTKSGSATDAWSSVIVFDNDAIIMDIWVWDNAAIIQRSLDDTTFQDEFEIPANTMYSVNVTTSSFRIKNKTAGAIARYQVIGWY